MPLLLYLEVCFHLWISAIFNSLLCYLPAPFNVWLSLPAPYYPSLSSVYLVGLSSFFVGLSSHVPLVFCILFCGISFCFWAACLFLFTLDKSVFYLTTASLSPPCVKDWLVGHFKTITGVPNFLQVSEELWLVQTNILCCWHQIIFR